MPTKFSLGYKIFVKFFLCLLPYYWVSEEFFVRTEKETPNKIWKHHSSNRDMSVLQRVGHTDKGCQLCWKIHARPWVYLLASFIKFLGWWFYCYLCVGKIMATRPNQGCILFSYTIHDDGDRVPSTNRLCTRKKTQSRMSLILEKEGYCKLFWIWPYFLVSSFPI